MSRKIMILTMALLLALGTLIPAASLAETEMYVYTSNGKSLNVRSEPRVADNIVKTFAFGTKVYVDYHLGNGWTALYWTGAEFDHVYVQTRFLVNYKPTKKPTPAPDTPSSSGSAADSASTVNELNRIFKTYRQVTNPYRVTVRPVRASGWVNLRFAPTKLAEVISTHRSNEQMIVIAEMSGWYQVEDPTTGQVGFMSSQFVVR